MRIYGWSFKSQDEFFNQYPNKHLDYIEDVGLKCKVACGFCGKEFILDADLQECPHCKNDLVFPRCDW